MNNINLFAQKKDLGTYCIGNLFIYFFLSLTERLYTFKYTAMQKSNKVGRRFGTHPNNCQSYKNSSGETCTREMHTEP